MRKKQTYQPSKDVILCSNLSKKKSTDSLYPDCEPQRVEFLRLAEMSLLKGLRNRGKVVKPGCLAVQYSVIKQEGGKTVQRNGIHVYTQASTVSSVAEANNASRASAHWDVRFVTGSCCHSIIRGTLI